MNQISLSQTGFELASKRSRKRIFLEQMEQATPWESLIALIAPHAPRGATGRPPFAVDVLLRVHFMQQWFGLSDPAMEEALHDTPIYREFAKLDTGMSRIPDETTILRFRHLIETHDLGKAMFAAINSKLTEAGFILKTGTVVDATLIAAPSSTKNETRSRDPEMRQTKKGNNYYHGMKAHIGVDMASGLVHTVQTTAANSHDVTQAHALLHGEEEQVYADSGYRGVTKREEIQAQENQPEWLIAMMPSKRKQLDKSSKLGAILDKLETAKAQIRAKVEHPFRVIKCQFGYRKTRYRGLVKNTVQICTLFALSNLWRARRWLLLTNPATQPINARRDQCAPNLGSR
jgi:transposase, IS5 family